MVTPASASPGAEQRGRWGSAAARQEASFNLTGAASPAIDAMIAALLAAKSHEDFVDAVRALDRVLQWNFYVIPPWYLDKFRIAYWTKLGRPDVNPTYGLPVTETWWAAQAK